MRLAVLTEALPCPGGGGLLAPQEALLRNLGQRLLGAPAQPTCQDPNRQSQQAKESQATGDSPVEKQLGDIPLRAALPSHLRRQPLRVGLEPLLQSRIGDLRDFQQP